MNCIKKKICDTNGATMIMAMMLILVATMVSCVVLTAASTSAKHLQNDRLNQQAYLTVSSAAQLVREELCRETYSIVEKETESVNGSSEKITTVTQADGSFASVINPAMENVLKGQPYSVSFTVNADNLQQVTARFSMDTDKNIKVVFSMDETAGYEMELELAAVSDVNTVKTSVGTGERKTVTTVVTTACTWEARDIVKVGA